LVGRREEDEDADDEGADGVRGQTSVDAML
jgi:hypothetical protein